MFDFFYRDRKNTNVTCEQQFLQIMQDGNWHSTDEIIQAGVIDCRSSKYRLKLKGYIFDRKTEGKRIGSSKIGDRYKTYYKLVGRVPECHSKKEKRNYLSKFSKEEIISELWKRDMLVGKLLDGEVVHFLKQ